MAVVVTTDPFATPSDMRDRTGGAITTATHPFLEKELAAATRLIQEFCGWHIAPVVEDLEVIRRSARRSEIWIPAMRISAAAVTPAGGVAHTFADDEFDPNTGWTSWSGNAYTLTYTAGFSTVPEDLVTLTLQIAARALGSPLGLVREQAGGVNVAYSMTAANVAGGAVLLDHEKMSLAAYRLGRLP